MCVRQHRFNIRQDALNANAPNLLLAARQMLHDCITKLSARQDAQDRVISTLRRQLETQTTLCARQEASIRDLNLRLRRTDATIVSMQSSVAPTTESRARSAAHKWVRRALHLLCLVACIWQAYQLTDAYLQYDVTAEALFYPQDPIVPPMLTICNRGDSEAPCAAEHGCHNDSASAFRAMRPFNETAVALVSGDARQRRRCHAASLASVVF